jgi:hypothetical protein
MGFRLKPLFVLLFSSSHFSPLRTPPQSPTTPLYDRPKVAARIGDTNVDAIQELVSDTIDWLDDHPDAEEDVYVKHSFIM